MIIVVVTAKFALVILTLQLSEKALQVTVVELSHSTVGMASGSH